MRNRHIACMSLGPEALIVQGTGQATTVPVVVPTRNKRVDTSLSLNDMLVTIGRAYLASDQHLAVASIRQLPYQKIADEFAWAVAYLAAKGLLTSAEELRAGRWVSDYLDTPFGN